MKLFLLISVVLLLTLPGCTTARSSVPADPSYAADVQPVFNGSCIACHSGSSPSGSYLLTSRADALGSGSDTIPNVIPGNAVSSKLYRKVKGIETPQMPLGGAPLDTTKIAIIRNWIDKGAKGN